MAYGDGVGAWSPTAIPVTVSPRAPEDKNRTNVTVVSLGSNRVRPVHWCSIKMTVGTTIPSIPTQLSSQRKTGAPTLCEPLGFSSIKFFIFHLLVCIFMLAVLGTKPKASSTERPPQPLP
jgi:hypothetical protein